MSEVGNYVYHTISEAKYPRGSTDLRFTQRLGFNKQEQYISQLAQLYSFLQLSKLYVNGNINKDLINRSAYDY